MEDKITIYKEIRLKNIFKFVLFSILQVIYHLVVDHFFYFPQTRKMFLQLIGARIGSDTMIMNVKFFNYHIKGPTGLEVGNQCFIGDESLIDLYDSVVISDQVTIAQRVTVLTHLNVGYKNHPLQKYFPKRSSRVVLKNGCVIAAGSMILPGVTVGANSFVAAGSVVASDVPPNVLVAGVPAKVKRRFKNGKITTSIS